MAIISAHAQRVAAFLHGLSGKERLVAAGLALLALALFHSLIGFRLVGAHAAFWRAPHNDMATMLAGMEALFHDAWRFPLTVTDRLLAPNDISIVYTDSIPWLAIVLKITGAWKALNGLGLFFLISYVLQPLSMLVLLRACGVRQVVPQCLGAILAMLLPAWLMRHGHVALTGHWLLMLALALSISSARTGLTLRKSLAFAGLSALAAGIHAYHLPPIGLCFAAAMVSEIAQKRSGALRRSAVASALVLASLALSAIILGYGKGQGLNGGRDIVGFYSMNLIGPLLPQGSALFGQTFTGGWFTQPLDPNGGQWFEGFNYLGAGVIFLIASAVLLSVRNGWLPMPAGDWFRRFLPLALAMVLLTLAAIGPNVYLANRLLFEGPQPIGPLEWITVFRAHGRFFWTVAYLLIAVSVVQLARLGRPGTILAVSLVALGLQAYDTREVRAAVRHTFSKPPPSFHPLDLEKNRVLHGRPWRFAPTYMCGTNPIDRMEISQLTLAAVRTGGTSDGASTARGQSSACVLAEDAFAPANPGDRNLTVVMEQSAGANFVRFAKRPDCRAFLRGLICGRDIDTVPGLMDTVAPVAGGGRVLSTVRFDKGVKPPELVTGWAGADPAGIWSDGKASQMTLMAPGAAAGQPVIVELYAMAFAWPPAVMQRIGVSVGGRPLASWTVEIQNWRPYRVRIPADLIKPDGSITIDFSIPGAKLPTPEDPRQIGLGIEKVIVSQ